MGRYRWHDGYIMLILKDGKGKKRYVFEHRHVMEQALGRKLTSNEIIHHKNGIRDDNRLENLEIMNPGEHSKHHHRKELLDGTPRKQKTRPSKAVYVDLVCPVCGAQFRRAKRKIMYNEKHGSVSVCGFKCRGKTAHGTYSSKL